MDSMLQLLLENCPAEVVQYAQSVDPSYITATLWPNDDPVGTSYSAQCQIAALGYYGRKIDLQSSEEWDIGYVWQTLDHYANAPEEVKTEIRSAIARMITMDKALPLEVYDLLYRERLDMREELKSRYPEMPSAERISRSQRARAYAFYMISWNDPVAYQRVDEAASLLVGPTETLLYLEQMFIWRLPGSDRIFRKYVNDGRQTSDVNGDPGLAVADWARVFLGMPRYTGPRQFMDEEGRPIVPRQRR